MKRGILIGLVVILSGYVYGQPGPIASQSVGNAASASGAARVNVTWGGQGTVQLFFNDQSYTFTEGRAMALTFNSARPYTLKVKAHDGKTYLYSEFIDFEKGGQSIFVNLLHDTVFVTAPSAALEQIKEEMVLVEGGSFRMGCPNINGSTAFYIERPDPTVILSTYYIGKYDITQDQWMAVMGSNPSHFRGCGQCPVESVSWDDAQEFIKRLNKLTGMHFRLPTNAEWEYAAKGGKNSHGYRYAGSNDIDAVAWYYDDKGNFSTHPVGEKQPNELGLYDMNGNVAQWCSDWYDVEYLYKMYASTTPAINPKGPDSPTVNTDPDPQGPVNGTFRVVRGQAWWLSACYISATLSFGNPPGYRWADVGFRLVLDLKP